jgi:hypothetical protein
MRHAVSLALLCLLVLGFVPSVRVSAQDTSLVDLLPAAAAIGPTFVVTENRSRTLDDQASGFANAGDAARSLADWDWQANAFRVYQSSELTNSGQPVATVNISLTRFATADGARLAMPYFVQDRAAILGQREAAQAQRVGDETRVLSGPVDGGEDITFYVRSGPLLLRISATSATNSGLSMASPEQIARAILEPTPPSTQTVELAQPADALPATLPLADAADFRVEGEGPLDTPGVAERLAAGDDAAGALATMGWQGGTFRQFATDPPPGGTGWVDLSLYHFADAGEAASAVSFFATSRARGAHLQAAKAIEVGDARAAIAGRAVNGTEYTLYLSLGSNLYAITGVAPDGNPQADVEQIATVLADPSHATTADVPLTPTPPIVAAAAVAPTATPLTLPTATPLPVPTAIVLPTSTPVPTWTPEPTETPMPTAPINVAAPAPTAATIPTAAPLPTAPTGPLPTPTPRVIHPPE